MRKSLAKLVALLVCLVFTISLVPAIYAAEKKVTRDDYRLLLQRPMNLLVSLFPVLGNFIDTGSKSTYNNPVTTSKTLKPTAEIQSPPIPPSDRD